MVVVVGLKRPHPPTTVGLAVTAIGFLFPDTTTGLDAGAEAGLDAGADPGLALITGVWPWFLFALIRACKADFI